MSAVLVYTRLYALRSSLTRSRVIHVVLVSNLLGPSKPGHILVAHNNLVVRMLLLVMCEPFNIEHERIYGHHWRILINPLKDDPLDSQARTSRLMSFPLLAADEIKFVHDAISLEDVKVSVQSKVFRDTFQRDS